MERNVGHEQPCKCGLVDCLDVFFLFARGHNHLSSNYPNLVPCTACHPPCQRLIYCSCTPACRRFGGAPCVPGCTLPGNLFPLEFLSSTSPRRRRTRRGGNGRSPPVQPGERSERRRFTMSLTFHKS